MSTYDSYETVEVPHRKHRHHHHHHDDRDRDRDRDRDYDEPRYVETRETYVRGPAPLDSDLPYPSRETDLIRRPAREDSDLSIEEVRRDFPPPGAAAYLQTRGMVRDERYGPPARSRSMERGSRYGEYLDDPREDRRSRKKIVKEEVVEPRHRSLSRNQKILAGVAGAALAVGGKELWDRRQNHGQAPEDRNLFATAALAAGGAFTGYEGAELVSKRMSKGEKKVKKKTYMATEGHHGDPAEYYSSGSDNGRDKSKKSHRKSIIEGALGLAGIGAAAKGMKDNDRDDRSDRGGRRSRRDSDSGDSRTSRRRDKSRGGDKPEGIAKFQQAAKAALLAGATEAFRVRNEPGGWGGAKGKRILTAAIGAGGIDAAADRDPERHSKRHILEAVIGGLAGNRLINGSRNELEVGGGGRGGRSRSRSRASGMGAGGAGLAALATAGLGALAAKKISDRSRSRGRDDDDDDRRFHRRRSRSSDGYDDRRDNRRRSKSVTDYARKGLAALGIGEAAEAVHESRRRDKDRDREVVEETRVTRKTRRSRDQSDDSSDDEYDNRRGNRRNRDVATRGDPRGDPRDAAQKGDRDKRVAEGKEATSDSDSLGSSTGDEKRVRKMKGKQLLTAGLASVATIHAAHSVYQSYDKRQARKKAVESGQMSKEEAKKLKTKALLQDSASIGIAALGIKGAFSEWKEMREMRHEYKEFEEKKEERHQKRVERQKHIKEGGHGKDSDGYRRRSTNASAPDLSYGRQPYYVDGNPYANGGLPAPPVGYSYDR